MRKLILLFAIAFFINGCSKDDNQNNEPEQNIETFNLVADSNSVLPYQLVKLTSDNISFSQETYIGQFNSEQITLAKNRNNELVFAIPNIDNGSYTFRLEIDNKIAELNFNITAEQISNQDETLNQELIEPLNMFNQDIELMLTEGNLSFENVQNLNSAKTLLDSYLIQFNSLDTAEKTEIAKFFVANPLFSTSIETANRMMTGNEDFDCFKINGKRVVLTTITILLFVDGLGTLVATGPFGAIGGLVAAVAGVYAAYQIISAAHQNLINDCFLPFEHILEDTDGNTNNFTFSNNSFKSLELKSKIRRIISADENSSIDLVSNVAQKFSSVQENWNSFASGINSIIQDITGFFNGWFNTTSTYTAIASNIEAFPNSSPESQIPGKNAFVIIEGVPNGITADVDISGESGYNIKFNTNNATLPQSFVMTIKYDDGDFQTTDEFNVTLEKEEDQIEGWYQANFFLAGGTGGVCEVQSGKEVKFYVNFLENNGNYTGNIYYREIDPVYGIPESSLNIEPLQPFGNNQLASTSENFVGDPNICDYSNLIVSIYVNTDGSDLEIAYGINMCQIAEPNECAVQSYGQTPTLMTYIGTETPSDL